ncbi:MAG: hypothetical protein E7284_09980 [Lachnospiraceae bacterium]|nr:hypothetical protein [Lachnospiraceae bacterium]
MSNNISSVNDTMFETAGKLMGGMITLGTGFSIFVMIMMAIIFVVFIILFVTVIRKIMLISRKAKQVTNSVKEVSQAVYGTDDIVEGFKRQQFEQSLTPRSVSNMSGVYLPKIQKDFPEFHYDEMRERAKNVLTSYLFSIDESDPSKLSEGNDELKNALIMHLQLLNDRHYEEHYERMKIHKCEISDYVKKDGRCTITFQAAIQYYYYITQGGDIKTGRKDQLKQSKYELELIYIQDRDFIKETGNSALGITCPNCAAPISNLGAKHCIYCGSPIVEFNIHAWSFSSVKEIK